MRMLLNPEHDYSLFYCFLEASRLSYVQATNINNRYTLQKHYYSDGF